MTDKETIVCCVLGIVFWLFVIVACLVVAFSDVKTREPTLSEQINQQDQDYYNMSIEEKIKRRRQ